MRELKCQCIFTTELAQLWDFEKILIYANILLDIYVTLFHIILANRKWTHMVIFILFLK